MFSGAEGKRETPRFLSARRYINGQWPRKRGSRPAERPKARRFLSDLGRLAADTIHRAAERGKFWPPPESRCGHPPD
jgi:hypothetical protein